MQTLDKVKCRTALIATSAASIVSLVPVALHQFGAVHHLPDPPFRIFDSDKITGSRMAHPFSIPDSALGMTSYSVTLALALASPGSSLIRRTLAAKITFDGVLAATNTVRQVVSFGKICSWCMATVVSSGLLVWAGRDLLLNEAKRVAGYYPPH